MQDPNLSQKEDVTRWLIRFKDIATDSNNFHIINRRDTITALSDLGMTRENMKRIILGLTVQDYCSGPEPDHEPTKRGAIWNFGVHEGGYFIYIKLKIAPLKKGGNIAVCLSFHPAEWDLCFPYK